MPIETARLALVPLPKTFMDLWLAGERAAARELVGFGAPDDVVDEARWLLEIRSAQLQARPWEAPWLVRAIVWKDANEMVGHIGFHGAPAAGLAEIGYTVAPAYRRRGIAREALVALMRWGCAQGVQRFRACIAPGNEASLGLVRSLGFVHTGEQWDEEDGLELVYELPAERVATGDGEVAGEGFEPP